METVETPLAATSAAADTPVAFFKRSSKAKSNLRKRPATPPPAASDSDSDFTSSEDEIGRSIKRRRKNAVVTASSAVPKSNQDTLGTSKFSADRSTKIESTDDATKVNRQYDTSDLDPKSLLGTTRALQKTDPTEAGTDGTYQGTARYTNFIKKNPNAPERSVGPMKAPTNIRTITVTDFAPDVCKDYKQTGFCGFGDSCKFLHAREDYKQGWELDRDWEIGTKGKKIAGTTVASADRSAGTKDEGVESDDEELENIPFACIICRKPYTNPIITKCGHYFCESCALQRYRKNPSCAACGAGTGGVFNTAKNLKKKLEKKREREWKRKEQAREEGDEASEEESSEEEA